MLDSGSRSSLDGERKLLVTQDSISPRSSWAKQNGGCSRLWSLEPKDQATEGFKEGRQTTGGVSHINQWLLLIRKPLNVSGREWWLCRGPCSSLAWRSWGHLRPADPLLSARRAGTSLRMWDCNPGSWQNRVLIISRGRTRYFIIGLGSWHLYIAKKLYSKWLCDPSGLYLLSFEVPEEPALSSSNISSRYKYNTPSFQGKIWFGTSVRVLLLAHFSPPRYS